MKDKDVAGFCHCLLGGLLVGLHHAPKSEDFGLTDREAYEIACVFIRMHYRRDEAESRAKEAAHKEAMDEAVARIKSRYGVDI